MSSSSFTATLLVSQTPAEACRSILNLRGWWSEEIEGSTTDLNSECLYHYQDIHICKLKLTELVPGKKIVWLVLDNYFKFTEDKSEWKGTKLVFDIDEKDGKTQVRFTHEGLVPQYECYEICQEAWTNYIKESLYKLITTGKGKPNLRDKHSFNAEISEKWNLQ